MSKNTNEHKIQFHTDREATEALYIVQRILTNIYAVLYRDATEALYTVQRILTNIIYAVLYRDVTEALYIVQRIVQHNGSPVHCPENTNEHMQFYTEMPQKPCTSVAHFFYHLE